MRMSDYVNEKKLSLESFWDFTKIFGESNFSSVGWLFQSFTLEANHIITKVVILKLFVSVCIAFKTNLIVLMLNI